MGHYLGLYHTFESCKNNDCSVDGDKVCDTPPQTKFAKCDGSGNSCTTDALSGFTSDQNDLPFNFMDYTSCPHNFTEGQKERMRYMLFTVRNSLLREPVCTNDCAIPAKADFTFPLSDQKTGDAITFTNTSLGNEFEWKVNGEMVATTQHLQYVFSHQGGFKIELKVRSLPDLVACRNSQINYIKVYCGVKSRIKVGKIKAVLKEKISFTSTITHVGSSTENTLYNWYYNDTLFSTSQNAEYAFTTPGDKIIYFVTQQGTCLDTSNYEMITVTPLPDYKLQLDGIKCLPAQKRSVQVTVCNDGYGNLPAGVPISLYSRNPTTNAAKRVGPTFHIPINIDKFCCASFEISLPESFGRDTGFLYAVINDDGSLASPFSFDLFPITPFEENNYYNNLDSLPVTPFRLHIEPKNSYVLRGSDVTFSSSANELYTIKWASTKGMFVCDTCVTTSLNVPNYLTVIATATTAFGCVARDTASVKIFIDGDVKVPTAFTPNQDGLNDIFYIIGGKDVLKIKSLRIYNRWGQKVFEKSHFPINDPAFGWDGKVQGKKGSTAVFVYYLEVDFLDGQRKTYKGTLTLIR